MYADEIDTPALVLHVDALERNLKKMAAQCAEGGVAHRPHAKTHKSPWIAARQVAAGAVGICAAKISEAEVFAQAGIEDILLTTEIAPPKMDRLLSLSTIVRLAAVVNDLEVAAELGRRAHARGLAMRVLVDINVCDDRTGTTSVDAAVELAGRCADTRGLVFSGLFGYEGVLQEIPDAAERRAAAFKAYDILKAAKDGVEALGHRVDWVTTAGTGTYRFAIEHGTPTEVEAGSYAVMDTVYDEVEEIGFEHSISIAAGVVSVRGPGRFMTDAGWKAVGVDSGMPAVRDAPQARYEVAGDEFGLVEGLDAKLRPGDKIWLVPRHCDPNINLYDHFVLVRDDGFVEGMLPITARGCIT